jgi:hypothetical protein
MQGMPARHRAYTHLHLALLLALACATPAGTAGTAEARTASATREQEMASCLPGELRTWPDGRDRPAGVATVRLVYRHGGAPPAFDEATVLGAVQRAARAWAGCGIQTEVLGEGGAALPGAPPVVVQWNEAETRGNFALANLGARTLSLSAAMFKLLAQRNPRHPAAQTLQMAVSHEMGHFFGLVAHSRRCIDVMSYYDNGQGERCSTRDGGSPKAVVEYRALLPTACDIARCKAVNGLAR